MLGLWYAIFGMLSGAVCSYIAKKKNRTQKNWYTVGQIFPIISIVLISVLNNVETDSRENEHYFDSHKDEFSPSIINMS